MTSDNSKEHNDLYDRQSRTYGVDATKNILNSSVTVVGLKGGLATEVCKNLVLSGVSNITLVNDGNIDTFDLDTGFYYTGSLGKSRGLVLSEKIKDNVVKIKLNEVSTQLENIKNERKIKDKHLVSILRSYDLIKELRNVVK